MNNKYFDEFVFEGPVEGSGGGGGGCFPAGEIVFTSHGWKPIQNLRKGDQVVAYDKYGSIELGTIVETHKHSKEENNSGIYTFTFISNGEEKQLNVTGNHAIFCGDTTLEHFKQAQDFIVGESFFNSDNEQCEITAIVSRDITDGEFTYNLTITPQHTYIVNGVRVHNGGGGKSGGASRPSQEDPNNLRSTNIARVMEVLSEGPIEGLTTNSLQDVYLNDTPVQNSDLSYNFSVKQIDFRIGLPTQDYVSGWNGVESVISIGTEVKTTQDVTHSLQASTDAALVHIRLPSGIHVQDTSTGDLHGGSVQLAIDTKPTGGVWTEIISPTIQGKAMTAYDTAYRINRPVGATTWEVRVRRITADPTTSDVVNATYVYEITEVQEIQLTYPDVAYVAIALDAQSVGNTIPVRSYDIKGIICNIPSNYNPVTRAYTGTWDGTFSAAWTDNPAWIVYDLLTNTNYGIGNFIDTSTIDVASFYSASQYNDELVDDGNGGSEPRFTFNQPISTRDDAWKVIQSIASTMRAIVMPGGIITLVQDRPSNPVKIVTNSNVKDGVFNYTGSGVLARHTVVNVLYNDKNDRYLPRVVTEEDTVGISRYGYNLTDLTAYGCVTEGQARRAGKWLLDTELNQTELVTYETGFNQADLIPGDVINVMDNDYITSMLAGRIVSATTTSITFDTPVVLKPTIAYKLTYIDADGVTLIARNITNAAGTYSTVSVNTALPTAVGLEGREWMVTSTADVSARQFRVVSVSEKEKGVFSVSALFYDPTKYARIETGISNPALVYSEISATVCGQISTIVGALETRQDDVVGSVVNLQLTWTPPITPYTVGYKVSYSRNNSPFTQTMIADNNTFVIDNVTEGTYLMQVIAFNVRGVQSAPYLQAVTVGYGGASALNPPLSVSILSGHGAGSEWYGQDLFVEWTPDTANNIIVGQSVGGYRVNIYDNDTLTLLRTVKVGKTVTSLDYSFLDNTKDGGPFRSLNVEVFTLNTLGQPSGTAVSAVFTNHAPAVVDSLTTSNETNQYVVYATVTTPATDQDGIIIYQGTTAGFTPSASNIIYQGALNTAGITIAQPPGSYYIKAAVYDTFGTTGLNVSSGVAATSYALGAVTGPAIPSGLTVNSYLDEAPNGSQSGRVTASWTANVSDTTSYEVRIRDITHSGQYTSIITTETQVTFPGLLVATQYGVEVQARNSDVGSGYTAESTTTTPGDTAAPGVPSSLTVTSSFKNNWLTWTKATDADLSGTEIWAGATNDRATASLVATTDDTTWAHSGLSTGTTQYYWVRSRDTSGNLSAFYPTSATAGVVGTTIGTATADYQNLSIVNAAIANLAVDTAKIADLAVTGAKIGTATIDTLNLKNGSVSDVKAIVDNQPTVISSATLSSGSYVYSYSDTEVLNFIFQTANPTTTETSFFTYLHAFATYDVYSPSNISISNNVTSGMNTSTVIQNQIAVSFTPIYIVQIVKTSDSSVVFTSPVYSGAAAVNIKNVSISNNVNSGMNASTVIQNSVTITGGNGQNISFGTVNLLKNTQYALKIIVKSGQWNYTNTTNTSYQMQVRSVNKAAYIQTILR